jgi:medium-chain acyl-[acyl-carrier-protein] hydrolase
MGALLAYETTKVLQTCYEITPMHLFLSGAAHPTPSNPPKRSFSELPDREFLEAVKALGGTPRQVMEDEAMMQFFLPMLRSDFTLVDGLRKTMSAVIHPKSVSCPITVFNGESDISKERMEAWRTCTDSEFHLHCLPGGHFYLFNKENEAIIVKQISKDLGF